MTRVYGILIAKYLIRVYVMEQMDYYGILGVDPDTSQKQIKEAYRKLAFEYHPDRNRGNPESTARMKAINEAYAVLSNPAKRGAYDGLKQQYGHSAYGHFRQSYTEDDIFRGSDVNHIFEEVARLFGLRGFDDIFKEFYGQDHESFEFKRPGFFARGYVFTGPSVSPLQGVLGKAYRHLLQKMAGMELPTDGENVMEVIVLTPDEARNGGPYPYFYRKKAKKLVVIVPPGMREGQRIRLAGMGVEGKAGGKPGDLYLKVKIRKSLLQSVKEIFSSLRK